MNTNIQWQWVAKEVKGGWKVSFSSSWLKDDFQMSDTIFTSEREVRAIFGNVTFINKKKK